MGTYNVSDADNVLMSSSWANDFGTASGNVSRTVTAGAMNATATIILLIFNVDIYFLVAEYSLYCREGSIYLDDTFKKIEYYYQEIKNFASNSKVREIIPFIQNLIDNKDNKDYVITLFNITKLKMDSLFSQADEIINEAKEFYENYQRFPNMNHYTTAIYVDCMDDKNTKIISNLFMSICFRIRKSSTQQNATLRELPKEDSNLPSQRGMWYIGSGRDATFWILQFAKEVINNLNGKDYLKIFYFADLLPNDHAVKIIDEIHFKYDKFWHFIAQFEDIIIQSDFMTNTIHEIRNSYITKSIVHENDEFSKYQIENIREIEIRLPNIQKYKLIQYNNPILLSQEKKLFNIGIITIVTEEAQAVTSEFELEKYTMKEGRYFYENNFHLSNGRDLKIVHLQSTDQGNISIVSAYESLIRNYTLDYVVLLGIAGSIKREIELCDVVIGTSIIYYEKKKDAQEGLLRRGEIYNMTFGMTQFINRFFLKNGEPAHSDSSTRVQSTFGIHRCPIGSGETIIANNLSETRKWLLDVHSKTGAVETESAGFCRAFYETKNISNEGMDIILIRGISDHADFGKDDKLRLPASKNAAIVLKKLLEILYE
jgi:adenosylhomocysteine nucleosidase